MFFYYKLGPPATLDNTTSETVFLRVGSNFFLFTTRSLKRRPTLMIAGAFSISKACPKTAVLVRNISVPADGECRND